jgi:uncharacterized protein YndB with AHSA1/START domain
MLPPIEWRVHLSSPPDAAFDLWTSDSGRERFWAERSERSEDGFTLGFSNGQSLRVEVEASERPRRFGFRYFGGSQVTVELEPDGAGGCDLTLREEAPPPHEHLENYAGWIPVLLAMKAALDFEVDLRSHDPTRSWERRYVDV